MAEGYRAGIQDSTPIMDATEKLLPEPSIYPAEPGCLAGLRA